MDTLNADAPALFLYAPANSAVVARRLEGVEIDPYSWLERASAVVGGALTRRTIPLRRTAMGMVGGAHEAGRAPGRR